MTPPQARFCIDPAHGVSGATGVAWFVGDVMTKAGVIRRPSGRLSDFEAMHAIARLVVAWAPGTPDSLVGEWPQVYPDERNVDPNRNLLPLAGVVAHVSGMLPSDVRRTVYRPREWKGTLKKEAFTKRILERLTPQERQLIEAIQPEGLRHNATDAAGLGLFHLGRLKPTRIIAREYSFGPARPRRRS